jgi:hypothetical protein
MNNEDEKFLKEMSKKESWGEFFKPFDDAWKKAFQKIQKSIRHKWTCLNCGMNASVFKNSRPCIQKRHRWNCLNCGGSSYSVRQMKTSCNV